MVLRRPYAFLIKHFKLIHFIITIIFAFVAYVSVRIYGFLNLVIGDSFNRYDALNYVNYWVLVLLALALILCVIIYFLLKYKDKPRKIYVIIMAFYAVIGVFLGILFSYMQGFLGSIPETKTIRLYRDLLSIVMAVQYVFILIMLMRALGFDIKKFNFASDMQELNLNASDSEEVEVNTQIDTTNIARRIRKQQREFGYFFKEFKVIIIAILAIVFVFIAFKGYNYFTDKFKVYKQNDRIGSINDIVIKNSYYASYKTGNYVIVEFDISRYEKPERLNTGNMALSIGSKKYIPDKNMCYKFSSLGNCYKKQYINSEVATYIFVYSVDKINVKRSYILYSDSYDKKYKVKLQLKEVQ